MKNTFGFIGTGNMGGALVKAAVKRMDAASVFVANRSPQKAAALAQALGCTVTENGWIAENCGFIFLGVKPQMMEGLLARLAPVLAARKDEFVLVSMAAGLTMGSVQRMAGGDYPVIRIMPNTPVMVGKGMIQYCHNEFVSEDDIKSFLDDMCYAGRIDQIPESLIDAASALSGCGPAFMYMFLEAMADGGVACGLTREKALDYAAATMAGAAEMVLTSQQHPGALKDAVCSPMGSTICGLRALEEHSFRAAAMDCVIATYQRNKEMGK